jgi:PTS system ascorbate-specific IIC component
LRKSFIKVIESTFLTVLGFFALSIGGGAIGSSLQNFSAMFSILIGAKGTIAASDAFSIGILSASSQIATIAAIMLLLAILFNLLLAGMTRFKNIYLSTHIVMYFCVGISTMFMLCSPVNSLKIENYGLLISLIGAMMIAIYTTLAPSITTKPTQALLHEKNMNLCHHGLFSFAIAIGVGKLVGKCKKNKITSIEEYHLPRWLSFLKHSNITIILVMIILFVIVYVGAYCTNSKAVADQLANGTVKSLGVALVLDAFMFTAGLLVLIYGITMMVNELKECIKGISQRFIRGAVMSVDASLILKTQPTAEQSVGPGLETSAHEPTQKPPPP